MSSMKRILSNEATIHHGFCDRSHRKGGAVIRRRSGGSGSRTRTGRPLASGIVYVESGVFSFFPTFFRALGLVFVLSVYFLTQPLGVLPEGVR